MSEEVLRTEQLSRSFGQGEAEVHALVDANVTIPSGQLTVVYGPSGSGKTTLLNLLGGLDRPTSGRVILDGQTVFSELGDREVVEVRRNRIGYVFQTFGLVPVLSAAENVEVPLRLQKVAVDERAERVAEALEWVGLSPHATQRPYELSGGQQQRVGIARALVAKPDILIADEPTGQLDSDTGASIMELLISLTKDTGIASIVSTHDPILIERADAAVQLLDGRVVEG